MNEPAMHVHIINPDGSIEATSSLASFVKNNEHDGTALLALGRALTAYEDVSDARCWLNLGAGGTVGLVIVDGPCPHEPSPDDYVCGASSALSRT